MLVFMTVFITILNSGHIYGRNWSNLCPEVKKCRCQSYSVGTREFPTGELYAECSGLDPDLEHLPLENVTEMRLNELTLSNTSSIWLLQRAPLSRGLLIDGLHLPYFNFDWLSETCSYVDLKVLNPQLQFVSHSMQATSEKAQCTFRSTLNVTFLRLSKTGQWRVPTCVPDSISYLCFNCHITKEFDNSNLTLEGPISWPKNLKELRIEKAFFAFIENFSQSIPATLKQITITLCTEPVKSFPRHWSSTNAITHLTISSCSVSEIKGSSFTNLTFLTFLSLMFNKIEVLPDFFPSTLQYLYLDRNMISSVTNVRWVTLIHLVRLSMNHNTLKQMPNTLPASIQVLELCDNLITILSPGSFIKLKNLKKLDLSSNRLLEMPENLPRSLEMLYLNSNRISFVRSAANYDFCVNCTVMALDDNPWMCDKNLAKMLVWSAKTHKRRYCWPGCKDVCKSLSDGRFNYVKYFMSYAKYIISYFPFCTCGFLEISCSNTTEYLLPDMHLFTLQTVVVNHMPNLRVIPDGTFKHLKNLLRLDLCFNGLIQLPRVLPSSLQQLLLSDNQISKFYPEDQATLNNLKNLKQLILCNNRITILYGYQLRPLTALIDIRLMSNPFHCDCSMRSLYLWFEKKFPFFIHNVYYTPRCGSPPSKRWDSISILWSDFEYRLRCVPYLCETLDDAEMLNCSKAAQLRLEQVRNGFMKENFRVGHMPIIPNNSYWKLLDLSDLSLTVENLTARHLLGLETINLTGNLLTSVPVKRLPKSLKNLILKRNKISFFPSTKEVTMFLPLLELIDLRQNSFTSLGQSDIKLFPVIKRIDMTQNQFLCDCDIHTFVTWIQTNAKKEDDKLNSSTQNLVCENPPSLRGIRFTDLKMADYCPAVNIPLLSSTLSAGLLLFLAVMFLVNLYLHKQRKSKKRQDIVQGFRKLLEKEVYEQSHETESGGVPDRNQYKFDAFVSYRCGGKDEEFVYKMLEELEDCRERTLCLHERDFLPGRGIASNIVEAIVASRKVILVISRKYATSSWCQYEVQVALAQLHKRRSGRLLVPVLLEDVTKDTELAGSVSTILSAITGLPVPTPEQRARAWRDFWNKLDEALK